MHRNGQYLERIQLTYLFAILETMFQQDLNKFVQSNNYNQVIYNELKSFFPNNLKINMFY